MKHFSFSKQTSQFVIILLLFVTSISYGQNVPTITSFSPTIAESGETVTIIGTNFSTTPANNIVYFGGVKANIISASVTELQLTVPNCDIYSKISVVTNALTSNFVDFNLSQSSSGDLDTTWTNEFFTAPSSRAIGFTPGYYKSQEMELVDVDSDSDLDVLLLNNSGSHFTVFINDGSGDIINFSAVNYTTNGAPQNIKYADLDNDGDQDIVVSMTNNQVEVFTNNAGTFTSTSSLTASSSELRLTLNDFNKDGYTDIAVLTFGGDVQIADGSISGFSNFNTVFTSSYWSEKFASGDVNNDGYPEIFYCNGSDPSNLYMISNNSGTISANSTFIGSVSSNVFAGHIELIDYDSDGDVDVTFSANSTSIAINDGSGSFSLISGLERSHTFFFDLDNDGLNDIIQKDLYYDIGGRQATSVSTFGNEVEFVNTNPGTTSTYMRVADFNADNYPDLVYYQGSNLHISLFQGNLSPSITITENLNTFETCSNAVSNSQSFTVSAANLTANLSFTALTGYEYSLDDTTYLSTLSIPFGSGTLTNLPVYIRLTGASAGSPSGNVSISSTNASTQTITVLGTVNALPDAPTVEDVNYCINDTATALTATALAGHTLQWYTAPTGGTAETSITPDISTVGTTTYYVSQINDATGCESDRIAIDVIVPEGPRAFQQALNFDGVNDKVEVTSNANLNVTNFTLEAWVKIDPAQNNRMGIVGKPLWINSSSASSSNGLGYGLDIDYGSVRVFGGQSDGSWGGAGYSVTTANISGEWAHIAGTYDGSNFKLYINGVLVKTESYSGGIYNNTKKLTIGSWPSESKFFKGDIDDVRVWNVVRTASEIQQNKDNELAGNETGLVAYYNFNNGNPSGTNTGVTSLEDSTPNNLDGTLQSFALSGTTSNWVASGPMILGVSEICLGSLSELTHTESGGTWSSSDTSVISIDASGNITANAIGSSIITYNYTLNTCSYTSTKTVIVNALPDAPTVEDVNYCINDTATALTATALAGHTLQWYTEATGGTASTTSPIPDTSSAGITTYYVSQVNNISSCEGDRVAININVNELAPPLVGTTTNETEVFTNVGSTSWVAPSGVTDVNYLVVGGGGGGGNGYDTGGGAGGAGGMVLTGSLNVVAGQSYDITIGQGGLGGANTRSNRSGSAGSNSVLHTLIALGGSGGGGSRTGGTGAGGAAQIGTSNAPTGGVGGGNANSSVRGSGGGGGGAAGIGGNGSSGSGGSGGIGVSSALSGTSVSYGVGGTGARGNANTLGTDASDNTGNGGNGGGARSNSSRSGGNGGTGVVILSYNYTVDASFEYCVGETADPLTATASTNNTLQWYTVPTGGTASTSAPVPSTDVAGVTTYYVSQRNTNGCESTRIPIQVTVQPSPVISGETSVGVGDQITLSATTTAAASPWTSSDLSIASVDAAGIVTGNTSINFTNSNGCTDTYDITIVAGTTLAPVLTSPSSNTSGATTLNIAYTLPEAPLSGSVKLIFTPTNGGNTITWVMTDVTNVDFDYEVGANPAQLSAVVSGNQLAFETYDITISYQDTYGNPEASVTNTNIQTLAPPNITLPQDTYSGVINVLLQNITTQNSGGSMSTYSITPTLPEGLSFNTSLGVISGTPTISLVQTEYTVTATNDAGTDTVTFSLFIDVDTDGDGEGDVTDTDIDGDGIDNDADADVDGDGTDDNGTDTDGDGINDDNDTDIDGDGIDNDADADVDGDGTDDNGTDTDGDGINDDNDTDIDGDGIDNDADADVDGDGTDDNGTDTDGDGINDDNDTDIDGDGIDNDADADVDGDGTNDNGTDTDGDGINDDNDTDIDGDGIDNDADADVDGDGTNDNGTDTDDDGINNDNDTDDDNDGVLDTEDAFPLDDTEDTDTDNDGTGDNTDTDDDNDGVLDTEDAFPLDDTEDTDTDNDGTGDNTDTDIDGDGIDNDADADVDGDGTNDNGTDTDGDGINDDNDTDIDGDGIDNDADADVDGDGTDDNGTDTDGDGINDDNDTDIDGDGIDNDADADVDGDGTNDNGTDTDGDGINNDNDTDDDNDGVLDTEDAFPLDDTEDTDTDNDGTGDNTDTDIDGDGIDNEADSDPNGDGVSDNGTDSDNDGINDTADTDDDNDGVLDTEDNCPFQYNPGQEDRDNDGLGDVCDTVTVNISQLLTPNGDGINDTWIIYNIENNPNNLVVVFNRWGKQVFRKLGYRNDWNGTLEGDNNKELPNGSYYYQVDTDGNGSFDEKGWIYITR